MKNNLDFYVHILLLFRNNKCLEWLIKSAYKYDKFKRKNKVILEIQVWKLKRF